jgi:uncharacterized membrane protein YjjP (DUF1212 family)
VEIAEDSPRDRVLIDRTELTLFLGRVLFRFGASTQRIIDFMELLHRRLGGENLEVLVTYDAITVTSKVGNLSCTRVDASHEMAGVSIHGQGEIRRLLLRPEPGIWTVEHLRAELQKIVTDAQPGPAYPWHWLAAGAVSAGFCAFNGGDIPAIGIAIVASLAIFAVRLALLQRRFTIYLATLGSVCVGGLIAAMAARLGWSTTPELALVAPVLFLVPGVPMITGGIDITRNHNSIGIARIAYTLALTATIALGLTLSLPLIIDIPALGAAAATPPWFKPIIDAAWGALTAGGLAFLNGGRRPAILICAGCGAAARLIRETGVELGAGIAAATLLAAVATTVLAIWLGERRRMPSVILAVMGCLTLIPGFIAIVGVRGMFRLSVHGAEIPWPEAAHAFQMLLLAIFVAFAIIMGIIFTVMAIERDTRRV